MEKGAKQHGINVKKDNAASAAGVVTDNAATDPMAIKNGTVKAKEQKAIDAATQRLKKISTVQVQRPPTVRMDTAITLYMPPSVQVSYGANYTDTEIGAAAAVGAQAYNDIVSGKSLGDTVNKSLKSLGPELGDGMIRKALGAIDMIPGLEGALEVVEMQRGFIKAPRMELAFKGIPKRSFQYDFKMLPKSAEEAEEIQKIVRAFKLNMLPEMVQGSANRLTMPNTFDIQYMYAGVENQYLHKISTCVLETMNVTYGGDRYKTFEANATDRYHQWPMNYGQFNEYINDKYVNTDGTSNVDGVHHYEIAQTSGDTSTTIEVYNNSALYTGDTDFYASATIVTNREYEEDLQNKKREIKLLDPQYVVRFVEEYENLMKESII